MPRLPGLIAGLAGLLLAGALVLVAGLGFAQNAGERGVLADLISKALSTGSSQVSIGAVDGALSSDATIRDIVVSDRDGPWLRLDRARLVWTRSALLLRRLEVNRLEIGRLEILRRPLPDPAAAAAPANDAPILPELPLKLIVEAFQLGELTLGATVIGAPVRLSATGAARLGPPNEGLDLRLAARRLDRPGSIDVDARFVPQTTQLQLALKLDEPQGGLLATIADLPEQPPVRLDLAGDGPLDRFRANLAFTAGPTIGANGTADLTRQGAGRRLLLALDSRIAGLLPGPVAPVFEGSTRLDGALGLGDDGAVSVEQLALVSALARLDAKGRYGADRTLDFQVTAAARPNAEGRTVASGAEIGRLAFDGRIQGPAAGPRVDASLQAEGANVPAGRLGKLDLTFTATPNGPLAEPATRIVLVSDGEASGVELADPGLARFIGERLRFTLRGFAGEGGGEFETLQLAFAGAELNYAGRLGPARILGKAQARLPDLSRLSELAGRELKGSAALAAEIDAEPKRKAYAVRLDGGAEALRLDEPALDRLLAGRLTLAGEIRAPGSGGLAVSGLRLAGTHVSAAADGALAPQGSNLRASIAIPDLRRADPRLSGQGAVDASLTGPLDRLDAALRAAISNASALGRPIPRLALDANLRDLQGALAGDVKLSGEIEGRPANGSLRFARREPGGWSLPQLDLAIGSVALAGALDFDADDLAEGSLKLAARNLDDLSALALNKLGGRVDADLRLSRSNGGQILDLKASAQKLAAPNLTLERLEATLAIADARRKPQIDGDVRIDRAVIAGESVGAIRLLSKGAPAASEISLDASARGFALGAKGRLSVGEPLRFDLASFDATRDGRKIALSRPASFTAVKGGVAIRDLALAVDGGRIALDGEAGQKLDLRFQAQNLPLSAARLAMPALDLSGTLEAEATIRGTPAAPTGPWRLRIARLVAPQTRQAGLPPIEIAGQGALNGRQTSLDASLNAGRFVSLMAKGTAPLGGNGALDLAVQGRADAALANARLAADGRRLTGQVALDLRAGGTLAAPRLSGGATLAGGSFSDALQGVKLTGLEARFAANGPELAIERFSAQTPGGGALFARGNVRLDPAAGFPGAIRIEGRRAQLVANRLVTAVADLGLDLSGPLAQRPRIGGRVDIVTIEVAVPDRLPSNLRPVDGIRHVNAKGRAAARLAAGRKARAAANRKGARAPAFDAALDIAVSAPGRVFIRGRGIDAELGGELRVGGSSAAPALNGGFELRRGRLNLASQRLDFSRGRLTFSGDVTPELDFVAEARAAEVTARIIVSGSAAAPQFSFASSPELPQDEVLSRLLFARASGSLSPFQALQLAQTAAQFSGAGGDDVFERLRRSLGVDNLDVQVGPGGPTVGVSRALTDKVTLGVRAGAKPADSGVSVGVDLTRRLKLQAETNADGSAAVGVGAEWEY